MIGMRDSQFGEFNRVIQFESFIVQFTKTDECFIAIRIDVDRLG